MTTDPSPAVDDDSVMSSQRRSMNIQHVLCSVSADSTIMDTMTTRHPHNDNHHPHLPHEPTPETDEDDLDRQQRQQADSSQFGLDATRISRPQTASLPFLNIDHHFGHPAATVDDATVFGHMMTSRVLPPPTAWPPRASSTPLPSARDTNNNQHDHLPGNTGNNVRRTSVTTVALTSHSQPQQQQRQQHHADLTVPRFRPWVSRADQPQHNLVSASSTAFNIRDLGPSLPDTPPRRGPNDHTNTNNNNSNNHNHNNGHSRDYLQPVPVAAVPPTLSLQQHRQQQQQQQQRFHQQQLFQHQLQQLPPPRHVCSVETCRKQFRRSENLARHMRIHTGEKPYVCAWVGCGRAFARIDSLAAHKRTHERRLQQFSKQQQQQKSQHEPTQPPSPEPPEPPGA